MHDVLPDSPTYLPIGHATHCAWPAALWCRPAPHGAHADEALALTLRWPAAHVAHDVLPAALAYFPPGHAKHAASDAFLAPKEPYRPTAHDVPLAPLVHTLRVPDDDAYVPAGHNLQSAAHKHA